MVVPARTVDAAVFVVPMPAAIEVPTMRVSMHVPPVPLPAGVVHFAVLMIAVPPAIQMAPVRVAMDMPVVVPVAVVSVDVLRFLDEAPGILGCCGRRRVGTRAEQRQSQPAEKGEGSTHRALLFVPVGHGCVGDPIELD